MGTGAGTGVAFGAASVCAAVRMLPARAAATRRDPPPRFRTTCPQRRSTGRPTQGTRGSRARDATAVRFEPLEDAPARVDDEGAGGRGESTPHLDGSRLPPFLDARPQGACEARAG